MVVDLYEAAHVIQYGCPNLPECYILQDWVDSRVGIIYCLQHRIYHHEGEEK